ncbi:MAG: DUF86 domain-containing protein [Candidatus Wallbacteria bacterium]|nr:DUF86 domain-containing protein [Candidatus Wallbacteria bacterium]
MYDRDLVLTILKQISDALDKISKRAISITKAEDFTSTPAGAEKLDSICMLLIAVGEGVKNIDKITDSTLLPKYPNIDWSGVKGMRDIIAHHYFDVDADQVFWIVKNKVDSLSETIEEMINGLNN